MRQKILVRGPALTDGLLLAPSGLLYIVLLVTPLAVLVRVSLFPESPGAPLEGPLDLSSYRALADGYFLGILWRTIRIALLTTLFCLVMGYPLALALTRSRGTWRTFQMLLIVSPLFVSVVVRSYGWILLLGNRGAVNRLLLELGLLHEPVRLLYTEAAVVAALTEALLPFMTLSLFATLERIPNGLAEAARGLGATRFGAFLHVTLPLSLPGALSGALFVFMVSLGSYATPALIGGSRIRVMVTEIYTQVTSVFNWPLAASLSLLLLSVALASAGLARRFSPERPA